MKKKPIILGIESSCDETAASIITENEHGNPIILSNIVSDITHLRKVPLLIVFRKNTPLNLFDENMNNFYVQLLRPVRIVAAFRGNIHVCQFA